MGVFDVLPKDGSPMSIATLSDKLSADPTLLGKAVSSGMAILPDITSTNHARVFEHTLFPGDFFGTLFPQ